MRLPTTIVGTSLFLLQPLRIISSIAHTVAISYIRLSGYKDFRRRFIKQNYNIYIWVYDDDWQDYTNFGRMGATDYAEDFDNVDCSLAIKTTRSKGYSLRMTVWLKWLMKRLKKM
ncbi:MAG: hypothetical protein CM15mP83_5960 [Flavobacteriaceae bacterium]|nr:MAG: hypothetical protein CM15mP83_5960 [Flavobacteriaceae bacterium]